MAFNETVPSIGATVESWAKENALDFNGVMKILAVGSVKAGKGFPETIVRTPVQINAVQAVDYRALLVRYMASTIDAEGISFVDQHYHDAVEFTDADIEALRQIEVEAVDLLDVCVEDRPPVNIAPRRRVFLDGIELQDVLEFGQIDGRKWVKFETQGLDPGVTGSLTLYNENYEFREVPTCA